MVRIGLDLGSGVPVYRQIIDQVLGGIASGALNPGQQLPTVRQLAVDLAVNPNTVVRAYRELEIRGVLDTHQGTGTFVANKPVPANDVKRQERLNRMIGEFVAKIGAEGYTVPEVLERTKELYAVVSERKEGN